MTDTILLTASGLCVALAVVILHRRVRVLTQQYSRLATLMIEHGHRPSARALAASPSGRRRAVVGRGDTGTAREPVRSGKSSVAPRRSVYRARFVEHREPDLG